MTRYTCPNWPQTAWREPGDDIQITGCGATFDAEPDFEGLVDCPHCGIWFDPAHPDNKHVVH